MFVPCLLASFATPSQYVSTRPHHDDSTLAVLLPLRIPGRVECPAPRQDSSLACCTERLTLHENCASGRAV